MDRVSIEQRPDVVDERNRLGDWEADTVIGKKSPYALVTLVERKSRFTLVKKINRRTGEATRDAIVHMLKPYCLKTLTITCDNGKEFAGHKEIAEELGADVYFAHPYASWERGTNENTNGLIRQYIPKGTDFTKLTREDMSFIENRPNYRPRKCIEFDQPMLFLKSHCCT